MTDKSTSYQTYKDRYAAALERLCEEHPERDLDDLKREADEQVKQMAKAANNNDNKQTDRR